MIQLVTFFVATTALAVPQPAIFSDGFEPPETNFSRWSGVAVNGQNSLIQSTATVRSGAQTMEAVWAARNNAQDAYAFVTFDAGYPTLYAAIHLFLPVASYNVMGPGTEARVLRLGDVQATGSDQLSIYINRDATTGQLFFRGDARSAAGAITSFGSTATTPFDAGVWTFLEVGWEADQSQVRVILADPPGVVVSTPPLRDGGIFEVGVGWVRANDPQTSPVTIYVDDVLVTTGISLRDGGLLQPDGGAPMDAGTDAGTSPASDAGVDAGTDAGAAGPDAGTDGGTDPDGGLDGGSSADGGLPTGVDDAGVDGGNATGDSGFLATDGSTPGPGGFYQPTPEELSVGCGCNAVGPIAMFTMLLVMSATRRRRRR